MEENRIITFTVYLAELGFNQGSNHLKGRVRLNYI
jgi:hypothetical protein